MFLNVNYDSSVSSAPSEFKTAIDYVVNYFDTTFTNPTIVNINIGWGEVGGMAMQPTTLGESTTSGALSTGFDSIYNSLVNNPAKSATDLAALASLTGDPTGGGLFSISSADAKVLDLLVPDSSSIDGSIGFDSTPGTFNFDPNNRAVPGLYDFIGIAMHEISEVMGRVGGWGEHIHSALDLYRYSSPGVHQFVGGQPAYFSLDGGTTDLQDYNTVYGGDWADLAPTAGDDACLAFTPAGVQLNFSSTDVMALDAIGWNIAPNGITTDLIKADHFLVLREGILDADAVTITNQINSGQLNYTDYVHQLVTEAKDSTAAIDIINQFMSGHTLESTSLDSQVQTINHLIQQFGTTAVGWNGIGASLADSSFAPQFVAKYENLNGSDFINAVTTDVFGQAMYSSALQHSLDLYENFYAQNPDATDSTGAIRGKGYFIADMLHQASDIHWGTYPQAEDTHLVGLVNGTAHYGYSLFG